jgi:toxin CptA
MSSSAPSSTFRIDWRPSRWLAAGLAGLGLLAGAALMLSDLPGLPAAMLAGAGLAHGLRLGLREWRRPACRLVREDAASGWRRIDATGDAAPLRDVRWQLRGPMAVMRGRDAGGRRCQFTWGPDTLSPSARRQLRLAGVVSSRSDKPLPAVAA